MLSGAKNMPGLLQSERSEQVVWSLIWHQNNSSVWKQATTLSRLMDNIPTEKGRAALDNISYKLPWEIIDSAVIAHILRSST